MATVFAITEATHCERGLQEQSSNEIEHSKAEREPSTPGKSEQKQNKKEENDDAPAPQVTELKKSKKEAVQKESTPKVIAKNKTKAKTRNYSKH